MNYKIERRQSVTSTMDAIHFLAKQGLPEGVVVMADEQTAGRGRAGHEWFSPQGAALYCSVLLRPALAPAQLGWLTMIAALAAQDVVTAFAPSPAKTGIKWFNDVLLNDKKVCGILVESSFLGQETEYAVLGIGLNINTSFGDAPLLVQKKATSLKNETGIAFDVEQVMQFWLSRFAARYASLVAQRQSPAREFARSLVTLGKPATIHAGERIYEGFAKRIDNDGALVMEINGKEQRIIFGETV
ncbi:MAG: biotin--[acetyl-CoA-carboxylase] ligase [Anaerolineae bacterium]|nr:biotin--[acetyl-CoA-carboxylase] ligase [Thermoflexales bacterium]